MTLLIIIQLKSHFSIIKDLVNVSILLSQSIKCQYVTYDSIFLIILITLDAFLSVLSINNQCHLFSIASAPECEYFELNIEDCDEGSWTNKNVDPLQGVALGSIRIELLGPYCTAHWHLFSIASASECEYFACYFLLNCKAPYFSLFFDCYLKKYSLTYINYSKCLQRRNF